MLKKLDYPLARQLEQQPLLLQREQLRQAIALEKRKLVKAELIILGIFAGFSAAAALVIGARGLEAFFAGQALLFFPICGGIALVRGRRISRAARQLRQIEQELAR